MPDTLWVQIGGADQVVSGPLLNSVDEDVSITEVDVNYTTFGATTATARAVSDSLGVTDTTSHVTFSDTGGGGTTTKTVNDRVRLTDRINPVVFDDTPGNPQLRSPTARQFLGLDAMPSGWAARTQNAINGTPSSPVTRLTSVQRDRGVMADEETVDLRGVTVWQHAQDKSGISINFNGNPPDTSCSFRPAVVGSYASTPKAQVGRVWGLHADTAGHTAVPETGPWRQWKGLGPWKGVAVDGVNDPWDDRPWINCHPGAVTDQKQWSFIDGVWFRHIQDGISSNGSPIEIRNCLTQWNHDDGHEQDRNFGPLYLYKNLYWNVYAGISYDTSQSPTQADDNSTAITTVEGCVYGFTRALPFDYGFVDWFYADHKGHGPVYKFQGLNVSSGTGSTAPTVHFINSTILMLGQPAQSGLSMLCLPNKSTAVNSKFIYVDMAGVAGVAGDKPPNYPQGSTSWWRGKNSISLYQAGFDVHVISGTSLDGVCTIHGDHPVKDYFWPAVQNWSDEHPQYGLAAMTSDAATNVGILNST